MRVRSHRLGALFLFAILGLILPATLVSGCLDAGGAIGSNGRTCGYPFEWLDAVGLWVLDWIAISTMMLGVPILLYWGVLGLVMRSILRASKRPRA